MHILSTMSADRTRRVPAVDRAILEPLGDLTIHFAMIEETLKNGIGYLLHLEIQWGQNELAEIITCEMSFRNLVFAFQNLVRCRCEASDIDTSNELCKELLQIEEMRNALMHSHWRLDAVTHNTVRTKTTGKGKGVKQHREELTPKVIQDLVENIGRLALRMDEFIDPVPRNIAKVRQALQETAQQ